MLSANPGGGTPGNSLSGVSLGVPGSPNPDPENMSFSTPVFRPDP